MKNKCKYIGFDLGGTKLSCALVNEQGTILSQTTAPSHVENGWPSVKNQIVSCARSLLQRYPEVRGIGIASAGPLDSDRGVLLDPTNFTNGKKVWGTIPIVKEIQKILKVPVFLENDAAAAVLAEHWVGHARKHQNVVMLTLGTGLGVGVICNGKLTRGGRGLHPEGGHILLHPNDRLVRCGCGNFGCAEAFLSGKKFEERVQASLKKKIAMNEIVLCAKKKKKLFTAFFDEYAWNFALALNSYIVLYYPEMIVLSGGFSHVSSLFLKQSKAHLKKLLARRLDSIDLFPEIRVSKLQDEIGVIGGAYIAKMKLDD